jgi:ribonucleotide reductase alpha subunit/intein/homing endonuclease
MDIERIVNGQPFDPQREKYTYESALKASVEYFNGNELAAKVFVDKYALRDKEGFLLENTPRMMHERLAREFARIDVKYCKHEDRKDVAFEESYQEYLDALDKFARIVPQGSPMAAIGNPFQVLSGSNCVVVAPPGDSISDIFRAGLNLAQLFKRRCGVGTDLSLLRPDGTPVNNAARTTTGAWSFADFYSFITRKIGQCIAGGERVLTINGLKPIEDVDPGDKVWTKKGWVSVVSLLNNGKKTIFETKVRYGFSIKTTEDHVFAVESGGQLQEKPLKDIVAGDRVVLIPGSPEYDRSVELFPVSYVKHGSNQSNRLNTDVSIPTRLTFSLAYLLGYMFGDGNVEFDKFGEPLLVSLACAHAYPDVQDKLVGIISDVFGYKASVRSGDGAVNRVTINSKLICRWLQTNGILKQKSDRIRVPRVIWESGSAIQCAFIAGFFDADGTNGGKKKGYAIASVSYPFVRDLQTMLMASGIVSKIHLEDRSAKGWLDLYTIYITGTHAQERFVDNVAIFSAKTNDFVSARDNYLTPYTSSGLGIVSGRYNYVPGSPQHISASAYSQLKKEGVSEAQDELLITSEVISVECVGEEDTYDLELESEHLFWCEGFYVHNSGRRGALMLTLDVHHPDVIQFATMKHDLTKVTGANISVRLSDAFLKAVDEDGEYEQRWPCEGEPAISKMVRARDVWDTIVNSATKTAEPGLIFWDAVLRNLPANCYPPFKTKSTNPCSELPLSSFDSCRLVSLNLTGYVHNAFTPDARFDQEAFQRDVALAMRMGDNIVDLELELIERIRDAACSDELICDLDALKESMQKNNMPADQIEASIQKISDFSETGLWDKLWHAGNNGRRTGLGTHGLADALAQLRIKYDSEEALTMVRDIYQSLRDSAYKASVELAKRRGAFPVFDWDLEKDCEFIKRLPESLQQDIQRYGRRNISLLTQAPTGSVSLLSKVGDSNYYNVSSGVEPVFRNAYTRRKKVNEGDQNVQVDFVDDNGDKWQHFEVYHSNVAYYMETTGGERLPEYFVTSDQIDCQRRIALQGMEQQFIDHSISSTINLPKGTSPEVVGDLYINAWKKGLKGVTVYVDGSRDGVLITDTDVKDKEIKALKARVSELERQKENPAPKSVRSPKRPELLPSETHKVKVDFGDGNPRNAYVTVSFFPGTRRPYEILIIAPYSGLDDKDLQILELTARTTSMNLRHGMPVKFICEQLDKIGGQYIFSLPTNISKVLRHYLSEEDSPPSLPPEAQVTEVEDGAINRLKEAVTAVEEELGLMKCPDCGKRTYRPTGQTCGTCSACGYSGCG